jgi:hypothetical protein
MKKIYLKQDRKPFVVTVMVISLFNLIIAFVWGLWDLPEWFQDIKDTPAGFHQTSELISLIIFLTIIGVVIVVGLVIALIYMLHITKGWSIEISSQGVGIGKRYWVGNSMEKLADEIGPMRFNLVKLVGFGLKHPIRSRTEFLTSKFHEKQLFLPWKQVRSVVISRYGLMVFKADKYYAMRRTYLLPKKKIIEAITKAGYQRLLKDDL